MILALVLAAANPLVGAWRLERLDAIRPDTGQVVANGAVNDPEHATGILLYDASGWMALEIGAGGRNPDRQGPVGRQRVVETGSYYAYYGRYEVEPGKRVVRHVIADSLMPPEIGITAIRHYVLEGDRLTLTSDTLTRPDGPRVNRIIFRRLAGAPTIATTGTN